MNDEPAWTSKEATIAFIKLRDKCFRIFCLRLRDSTSNVTDNIVRESNLVPASRLHCFLGPKALFKWVLNRTVRAVTLHFKLWIRSVILCRPQFILRHTVIILSRHNDMSHLVGQHGPTCDSLSASSWLWRGDRRIVAVSRCPSLLHTMPQTVVWVWKMKDDWLRLWTKTFT